MPDDNDWALPAFNPGQALLTLQRELRALGLREREGVFERRGQLVARVRLTEAQLEAARVKRPSRSSPEWQARTLRQQADVRDFLADLKKQLAAWGDADD